MIRTGMRLALVVAALLLHRPALACSGGTDVLFAHGFDVCEPRSRSFFAATDQDLTVEREGELTVVQRSIWLDEAATLLAVADGRHFPLERTAAVLRIRIDGDASQSSRSITDWRDSSRPVQHSFNAIAHARLQPGRHHIALVASADPVTAGRFVVGSGSGLAVLIDPHGTVTESIRAGESQPIDLTTYAPEEDIDTVDGGSERPMEAILSHTLKNGSARISPAVTLVSGRAAHACSGSKGGYGDALWGLWTDGTCPATDLAAWSVNDIDRGAELQAPMSAHALAWLAPRSTTEILFGASELAFGSDQMDSPTGPHENDVCYRVADARMISVANPIVVGTSQPSADAFCSTYIWRCVASSIGRPGCPPTGTEVVIGTAEVEIPHGHDGIVLFSARTRVQGDNNSGFGTVALRLRVNGNGRGTTGVQQLAAGYGAASRTLTAAWLSADYPLNPGTHQIEVVVQVHGDDQVHVSVPGDVPLVYFD